MNINCQLHVVHCLFGCFIGPCGRLFWPYISECIIEVLHVCGLLYKIRPVYLARVLSKFSHLKSSATPKMEVSTNPSGWVFIYLHLNGTYLTHCEQGEPLPWSKCHFLHLYGSLRNLQFGPES